MRRFLTGLFLSLGVVCSATAQTNDRSNLTSVTRWNSCEEQKLLSYNPISGTVPMAYGHMPATDLVCDSQECAPGVLMGEVLTAQQADEYYKQRHYETRCQWTLADLDPVVDHESAHIWKGGEVSDHSNVDLKDDELELNDLDQVDFVSQAWARLGNYRVTVNKNNFWGMPTQYSIYLSKTVHNFLLRKALLRKLGYIVPPVKRVPRLKINFPDADAKKQFIKNISINNAGSFDRWILSEDGLQIVVQDVVVMEDQEFNYNLAKGYLSENVFQGKRIFDSLVVPFALVDAPESINLMEWVIGRRYSDNIVLKFPHANIYNCSRDDAVWMTRRIMELTENDWKEIVDATSLPPSVKLLLLEKLKSRRNHLGHLFNVENINLPVNPSISNHDDLEQGEITKEFYDGYARRFRIPDPESPLSHSEMSAFFKSKAISMGIDMMVNTANSYLTTDIGAEVANFQEMLAEEVAASMTEGSTNKLPIRTFVFPTVGGNLILNREIVAGSYLGTDNLIQLVDTVGASVNVGAFGGLTGVYTKTGATYPTADGPQRQYMPVDLHASSSLFFNRTYAHVKPITSVQKALRYPFRNMFVPYLKRKYGRFFDVLMDEFYQDLTPELKLERNKRLYQNAKALLEEIKYHHTRNENRSFSSSMNPEFESLMEAHASLQQDYEQALVEEDVPSLAPLGASLREYYLKAKDLLKTAVLRDGVCLVKELDTDEEVSEAVLGERCAQDPEDISITPENIRGHYPHMSSLLSAVDGLNDLHNLRLMELQGQEEKRELDMVMKTINNELEVGESIIVTDSFGASLTLGAGASLYEVAKTRLNVKGSKNVVNRLHIHRSGENEIHVYKDLGNINSIEFSTSVEKYVPIMKFTFKGTNGSGRTKFHKIPIGETLDGGPNHKRADYLRALRNVFMTGSTKTLERVKNPFVITHRFKEKARKLGLFVWRWNWLNQSDEIQVTSPEGFVTEMYRRNKGKTSGRDFENYAKDLVDLLSARVFDGNFNVRSFNKGNPGYTFMGKAKNKVVTYEGIKDENGAIPKPYVKLSRIWNGWKMSRKDALELLEKIKQRYSFRYVEEEVLAQTEELFLYNINVNFFVYDSGIEHMLKVPEERVEDIFIYHRRAARRAALDREESLKRSGYYSFAHNKRKYLQAKERENMEDMAKYTMKMIEAIEDNLYMSGMGQMFGGGGNVFSIARVDGFRVGDGNGDKKIISNSFGRIGTENLDGPISRIKNFIGITNGEFTLSWLLGRVI